MGLCLCLFTLWLGLMLKPGSFALALVRLVRSLGLMVGAYVRDFAWIYALGCACARAYALAYTWAWLMPAFGVCLGLLCVDSGAPYRLLRAVEDLPVVVRDQTIFLWADDGVMAVNCGGGGSGGGGGGDHKAMMVMMMTVVVVVVAAAATASVMMVRKMVMMVIRQWLC